MSRLFIANLLSLMKNKKTSFFNNECKDISIVFNLPNILNIFIKNIIFGNSKVFCLFCYCKFFYMTELALSVQEQIKKALDGRTQRWLSFEVRIPEYDLSKKINGLMPFTEEELSKIEERLSFKLER